MAAIFTGSIELRILSMDVWVREGSDAVNSEEWSAITADQHVCTSSINAGYYCAGPAYDNFTVRFDKYRLEKSNSSNTWGRRSFPLPANVSVFMLGNSHTRQMYNAILCQYRAQIDWKKSLKNPYDPSDSSVPVIMHFKNNATIAVLSNVPLVYSATQWVSNLEKWLERPLSSFDAVVMGRINGVESKSNFGRNVYNFSLVHPELFDPQFPVPTIQKLADVYDGPIVAVPMFAAYGQDVKTHAEEAIDYWITRNRTNIHIVDARKHIQFLGECASDERTVIGVCLDVGNNDGGRNPQDMHRCTGQNGGHPDLVAWDVIEQLFSLLEQ